MMNLNTLRLTGVLSVKDEAKNVITDEIVQLDDLVGAGSFIQTVQTFVAGVSVCNVMEYPRLVKMITSATENSADMFSSHNICELKTPNQACSQQTLRQEQIPSQHTAPVVRDIDFSVKPMIGLNQVYGDKKTLSSQRAGDVRVVFTLARDNAVLFGNDVIEGYSYALSDLRLEYTSYPDDGDVASPILFKKRQGLKQSFSSQSAQLNFSFPMTANKVYGSFLFQADENQPTLNNLALQKPPDQKNLTFYWNNTTNEYISYQLRSANEIIERYVDAIGEGSSNNSASLMNIANNNAWGCGLNLGEYVDLMNTKLSIVIESGLLSSTPMILFLYAEGVGRL
jgi:hypothetical protein